MKTMKDYINMVMEKVSKLNNEERTCAILFSIAIGLAFPFGVALRMYQNYNHPKPTVIHVNEIEIVSETTTDDEEVEPTETTEKPRYHTYDIDYNNNHIIKVDGRPVDYYVQVQRGE